jgi:hypothetical protein
LGDKEILMEMAEEQGFDDVNISFIEGFGQKEAKEFLDIVNHFNDLMKNGDITFTMVVFKSKDFLFYNRKCSAIKLVTNDPKVMCLQGNSPDVIYYGKDVLPMAFPTRCYDCNSTSFTITFNNGNKGCTNNPNHTTWRCSVCGVIRDPRYKNTVADPTCPGGYKCMAGNPPGSQCTKCRGIKQP